MDVLESRAIESVWLCFRVHNHDRLYRFIDISPISSTHDDYLCRTCNLEEHLKNRSDNSGWTWSYSLSVATISNWINQKFIEEDEEFTIQTALGLVPGGVVMYKPTEKGLKEFSKIYEGIIK